MPSEDATDALLSAAIARIVGDFERTIVDIEHVLGSVTSTAVELIGGIDHADVVLIEDGTFHSMASTARVASQLDDVQLQCQEGPCLTAAVADCTVRCPDLRTESRWPQFASAAIELGVYSVLSFQLYTHDGGAGALNLLGDRPQVFTRETETAGAMLATHAAIALAANAKQHQFESALASRDTIGQAKGILMERFGVDAVGAFDLLKRLSQETNAPLRDLAAQLVNSLTQRTDPAAGPSHTQ
ncbi:ANTAR domain-containing protein [Mycobacterium sp. 236(2023)]|uniref:ANTAR domain-containing protein n=1 Tax=Mycobacterium sp. 236(2023) TaxID=3038163 RepID=UPI002415628E|nr:ANTAR domain-containing protein [Mycobacterium sp. 236(2023)]MDG4667002.1 ANTAR domain-containing protein [Mycobacterium sp. 236(2023)]